MIVGQNALLNQYVPTFYIRDLRDGQGVIYDSVRKAFVNADIGTGTGGADRLGELLDVAGSVDNPLSLQNGQALTYNSFTSLWENTFIDYNTLLNKPAIGTGSVTSITVDGTTGRILSSGSPITTSGTITLDLAPTTVIPGAYTAANITVDAYGRITSATNGVGGGGSVTTVSVVTANGISGTVATATTTPAITLTLGAITPTSVAATGTVTGTNLSGTNTGDQTITLTGDVTGTGTSSFATTLATVNSSPQDDTFRKITVNAKGLITATSAVSPSDITTALGFTPYNSTNPAGYTANTGTVTSVAATGSADITVGGSPVTSTGTLTFALSDTTVVANTYGSSTTVPVFTVDAKGRITGVTNTNITASGGTGTVTSVNASGGTTGLTFTGGPITSSGTVTLSGILEIANGGTGSTTSSGAANAILPSQESNDGKFLTTDGIDVFWADVSSGTGSVTTVSIVTANGVSGTVLDPTSTPAITIELGDITPTSVAATGTVTGSNLSGTNTGDQTITLTGDVTGSGTDSFETTLATVNLTPGTYGDDHLVPTIVVNEKGLVTSITTQHVDTTVRDLVPETDVFTVAARHQYIVTSQLEVDGMIINNGVIAIL